MKALPLGACLLILACTCEADVFVSTQLGGVGMVQRLDSSGNATQVVNSWNGPPALAFDAAGNLYLAGGGAVVAKCDSTGNWHYFASDGLYRATALAFD